ncbi:aldehyde dehydrogenase family protein [Actinomadura rubrisoli]|uniref:Aldehyde dehydrogenase family protein n=1 Tax=Actinomadura rubrisoli TaxID=2530368 RepID=A0A4R5CGD8_9ACTN|nr:aldehyde dehydrogenase family protein [Actinomadura rubrisoli]TDD96324.1 aldehyde dehydrogenase family protein [Actinomadura rubrisoli]
MKPTSITLPPTELFIDGEWRPGNGGTFTVESPTDGTVIAKPHSADAGDVDRAVAAARRAFDLGPWPALPGAERGRLLHRLADLIEENATRFAELESLDVGKPYRDALAVDVDLAVQTFRHFAGWADKLHGSTIPVPDHMGRPRFSFTERVPVGVVGAITPWNAPTMITSWKLAPALAAGCTVVLKPAEDAPLVSQLLAELAAAAGLPAGVLNVVNGPGRTTGAAITAHPGIDKLSFTGSPEVGRAIGRAAAERFTRVTLELGGKSPQIVLQDADIEALAPVAAVSLFANSGQTCAAGTRILVHRSRVDDVAQALAAQARAQRLGDPFDAQTTMGSLINAAQRDRVMGYVTAGLDQGAELITGGTAPDRPGYYVEPTLFVGTNDLTIAREEIFGPVGTIIPFDDTDEAIRLANATRYGLAAVIWSQNIGEAMAASRALRVGAVWVNSWGAPDPRVPWGGMKSSGVGRELGLSGLLANTEERLVNIVY